MRLPADKPYLLKETHRVCRRCVLHFRSGRQSGVSSFLESSQLSPRTALPAAGFRETQHHPPTPTTLAARGSGWRISTLLCLWSHFMLQLGSSTNNARVAAVLARLFSIAHFGFWRGWAAASARRRIWRWLFDSSYAVPLTVTAFSPSRWSSFVRWTAPFVRAFVRMARWFRSALGRQLLCPVY